MVVKCKIRIDRYNWKFNFYVVEELMYPLILRTNFLQSTGPVMDVCDGLILFHFNLSNKLPLHNATREVGQIKDTEIQSLHNNRIPLSRQRIRCTDQERKDVKK
jgi:hypothetical protein